LYGVYYDGPKNKKSIRKPALPATLIPILKKLKKEQTEQKLRLAEQYNNKSYVFKS
jgi:hypothetical protein